MPIFTYRALTASGERSEGEIEANDQRAAIQLVQARGLIPIEAEIKAGSMLNQPLFASQARASRVSPALAIFTRELATLLRAGEPLERAMALIADETGEPKLSAALKRVLTSVRSGQALGKAIEAEPQHFPRVYVGMVGAGEATGQLHQALDEVANLAERQQEARRKFIASITYPLILSTVAIAAVGFMLGLVVPQFAPLLEGHEARLPAATNFVLGLSHTVREQGLIIVVAIGVVICAIVIGAQFGPARRLADAAMLKAGWLGSFPKERVTAQLARALGTLLKGGLDLPSSIAMSSEMIDNSAAREALARVRTQVRQGQRLADALQREGILAPMGHRLIRTGEESGRLGELAAYLADQMDRRLENRMSRLLSLLEPVLVVTLGLVVGGITVAILSAMLSVNELAF